MSGIAAYRLVKRKWLDTVFDGEGARRFGGRWNSRGKSCVYLAGSESLALLEVMVHLDDYSLLQHYALLEVRLPEDQMLRLPESDLPGDWRDEPAPPSTADRAAWCSRCRAWWCPVNGITCLTRAIRGMSAWSRARRRLISSRMFACS